MAAKDAAVRVEDFLRNHEPKIPSIEKSVDIGIDCGNLLTFDVNEFDLKEFRESKEQYLLNFTKGNVQLLINSLGKLPVEKKDDITVVKLPESITLLPREKPVPKPRQPTKWEQFARLKGIQKKKKGRMLWDPESQQYKPRWGFKRKDPTKSWALEVPDSADPMEDQFEKLKKAKRERVAKNELQRLRNLARGKKSKVPGVGLTPTATPSKAQLETALAVSHRSTASLGQFTERLPKEKIKEKKRKFLSNEAVGEKEKALQQKILKKISDSRSVVDVNRAANALQQKEERQRAAAKKDGDGQKRKAGSKGKGGKGGKGVKGGKGGKRGKGKKSGGKRRH